MQLVAVNNQQGPAQWCQWFCAWIEDLLNPFDSHAIVHPAIIGFGKVPQLWDIEGVMMIANKVYLSLGDDQGQ